MNRVLFLLSTLLFLSCTTNGDANDCFPFIAINETVNLDLPQFIDLQVTGGHTSTQIGERNILIIRRSSNFQAFDLQCPEQNCSQPMNFDGLNMICPCNDHKYNSLNGSPSSDNTSCFAKEYLVQNLSNSILRITNF